MNEFKCFKEESFIHLKEDVKEMKQDLKEMGIDIKELLAEKHKQRGILVALSTVFTFLGFIISIVFGAHK